MLFLVVFGTLFSCRQKPDDKTIVRLPKYKKSIIDSYQKLGVFHATNMVPGFSIAVSIDNQIVWADGIGYSNYELKTKASPSHKFRLGQVTELITAITAAKLSEEGKLQIDKPVAEYLPDMKPKSENFTIRQLGAHSAGIREEESPEGLEKNNTLDKTIASFIDDDLIYKPGAYYVHSGLNYDLIAHLIEKATNSKFSKVVKETLTDTLQLDNTIYEMPMRITENKSNTYDYDFIAQPIVARQVDLRGKEASVGYLSSVLDLVKLGNTLIYPGFLKQETIDLLTTPFKLNNGMSSQYSFGLIISKDDKNHPFYGQRGSVTGGSATVLIYPEDKMVIAIAGNIQGNSWEYPVFEVAQIFQKQLHPEEKEENKEEK